MTMAAPLWETIWRRGIELGKREAGIISIRFLSENRMRSGRLRGQCTLCLILGIALVAGYTQRSSANTKEETTSPKIAQLQPTPSANKAGYYCAIRTARKLQWEKAIRVARSTWHRLRDNINAKGGIIDRSDATQSRLFKENDAHKRAEVEALSNLYDVKMPILILLGESPVEVQKWRSALSAGIDWRPGQVFSPQNRGWDTAIGKYSSARNPQIDAFCDFLGKGATR